MTKKEVQMLVQLREYAREQFESLEGKHSPMSTMKVQDVGYMLSSVVNSLDDVLKDHVQFGD